MSFSPERLKQLADADDDAGLYAYIKKYEVGYLRWLRDRVAQFAKERDDALAENKKLRAELKELREARTEGRRIEP
jgi:uncharacterized coiled-coil DUF342 family protein